MPFSKYNSESHSVYKYLLLTFILTLIHIMSAFPALLYFILWIASLKKFPCYEYLSAVSVSNHSMKYLFIKTFCQLIMLIWSKHNLFKHSIYQVKSTNLVICSKELYCKFLACLCNIIMSNNCAMVHGLFLLITSNPPPKKYI